MVLLGRIELPTSSLPMTRSTTELQQRTPRKAGLCVGPMHMSSRLRRVIEFGIGFGMKPVKATTKEERLAEALRANLRRRKALATAPAKPSANSPKSTD
jgi:hypothetical protein